MQNNSNQLKKLHITQRDMLYFTVLLKLQETSIHAAEIHRFVSESFKKDNLSPNRSKAYVYNCMKEMERLGWITHKVEGKKKIFSIRREGEDTLTSFKDMYLPLLLHIDKAVSQMMYNVSNKAFHDVDWSLTDKEKQYLSKILNVKAIIQWYILHRLHEQEGLHGGELYREMDQRYAWINSHGYFYQVLRDLDHEGFVTSQWANEETRSKRTYHLTDAGKRQYVELTEQVRFHLHELRQFLRTMIQRFDHVS
ncbi:PadR family transcriptional regulator [Salisediminibacterium selenitireducens]|uniref:Transcriptional regulator, PadR-like family n=1 Tax=Bacillus selenitireducens (strain ATCC 700615 / DSM 15326 / MLS10) TaxID=439292 RepID=D6XVZ9_BACIE|nr:helix-turn-helix transcriptional regulator [Salisediminibacterium selenitireducens]ADH97772.1 transcriptional regulator, PadR-like family [[Bacillus] selenitireducens MLS10]